jgi:pimeloyl-ACP methyl ester carboxylesterase
VGHRVVRASSAVIAFCVLAGLSAVASARAARSVIQTPIRTMKVPWGTIGYRSVGHGRPLVLVVGSRASIDDWAPKFIDAIARHHHVLALDNEGVGRTTLRPGRLTVTRMGDDVADFIAVLHLKRPDVLGWSMGGEVVQTLAVRHPRSLRRIVLCATAPGDGSSVLSSFPVKTSPPFVNFFPADQDPSRRAFISDIDRYRDFYAASEQVAQLQQATSSSWAKGLERAGHRFSQVRARVLIGEGAEDPLVAVADSRTLAAELPHSQLHIYPDAAHGFWFQDRADWVRRIDRFLQ